MLNLIQMEFSTILYLELPDFLNAKNFPSYPCLIHIGFDVKTHPDAIWELLRKLEDDNNIKADVLLYDYHSKESIATGMLEVELKTQKNLKPSINLIAEFGQHIPDCK